jgi:hypothetical protein
MQPVWAIIAGSVREKKSRYVLTEFATSYELRLGYWPYVLNSNPNKGKSILYSLETSRHALRPNKSLIQLVHEIDLVVQRSGRDVNKIMSSSDKVIYKWTYTSTISIRLKGFYI